jgi:hypothetical protein
MKHLAQIQTEFLKVSNQPDLKLQVIEYFTDPAATTEDEDYHAHAAKLGVDKHELENAEHAIMKSFWSQGRFNESKRNNKVITIDPNELKMGIKVEMEHTDDPVMAERISKDHLAEISDYYTRLKKMEEDAGVKE